MTLRVLDLFCGVGGAAIGIRRAIPDCEIVGVDNVDQPDYPFKFVNADAMSHPLSGFDLIWASPPCQAYSWGACKHRNRGKEYPDLVAATRERLLSSETPWIIENVPSAPIRRDLLLCGKMFGLKVIRHRHFEISGFHVPQPRHRPHRGTVPNGDYVSVAGHGGHGSNKLVDWQNAVDVHHTRDKARLAQVVPPAYSEFIVSYFGDDDGTQPQMPQLRAHE